MPKDCEWLVEVIEDLILFTQQNKMENASEFLKQALCCAEIEATATRIQEAGQAAERDTISKMRLRNKSIVCFRNY